MTTKKTPRNACCPCGGGLKFKKCCLRRNQEARRERQRRAIVRIREELQAVWSMRRSLPVERGGV